MLTSLKFAAAAGFLAAPALAADMNIVEPMPLPEEPHHLVTAHLEMSGGAMWTNDGVSRTLYSLQGAARFNVAFGQNANVQIDLGADYTDYGSCCGGWAFAYPVAHLWYGSDSHAVGAFGGAAFNFGETLWIAGLEGEAYFGNFAIGGQAAYNFHNDQGIPDFWKFMAKAKYYVNPDLKLSGDVQTVLIDNSTIWRVGGAIEKRHTGSPMSGFAEVGYVKDGSYNTFIGMVGFRLFADAPGSTLYSHDMQVPWSYDFDWVKGL